MPNMEFELLTPQGVISLPLVSCHDGVLVSDCISVPPTLLDVTFSWLSIVLLVFRSFSETGVLYVVVGLVCPWKVSVGSSSSATLIPRQ